MFLTNAKTMRELDANTQNKGVSSEVLMENAATATVCEILKQNPKSVTVFCGKGQNGGDGYAIARRLFIKGVKTTVCALFPESDLSGGALTNYIAFKNIGGEIIAFSKDADYESDVFVDCLLGTGAKGEVHGKIKDCIDLINSSIAYKISADLPSGINADTGEVLGTAVKADKTITYGFYKEGLFSPLSVDYTGTLCFDDVSILKDAKIMSDISTFLTTENDIYIPKLSKSSHKGTCGRVLIAGGSEGLVGAPVMAADAALKSGAGLVTVASFKNLLDIFMGRSYASMCTDIEQVDFSKFDTVLIGNGMGTAEKNLDILEKAINNTCGTLIIDADAITLLSKNKNLLKNKKANVILTPHPLEFSRLCGISTEEILKHRVALSKEFSKEFGVTLILKTAYTVVSSDDGVAYINSTGNEGMAKGGSGDVLAGMLAGMAYKYPNVKSAAICATYLHSLAGDIAAEEYGKISMNASDIITCIPKAINLFF